MVFVACPDGLNPDFTMIIKNDSTVWGTGKGTSGRLGTGNTTNVKQFTPSTSTGDGAIFISCGETHTMIIKNNHTVWGCGDNIYYQLGNGTTTASNVFIEILSAGSNVDVLCCSYKQSMIFNLDGTVRVVGNNQYGQNGTGSNIASTSFTHASSIPINAEDVVSMSSFEDHTMILKTDGTIYGAGENATGWFGNGSSTTISSFTISSGVISRQHKTRTAYVLH